MSGSPYHFSQKNTIIKNIAIVLPKKVQAVKFTTSHATLLLRHYLLHSEISKYCIQHKGELNLSVSRLYRAKIVSITSRYYVHYGHV